MPQLAISILGPARVTVDGADAPAFDYAKVLALLVYLAAEGGRPHGRDALAELLWPDQEPQVGRSSLRQALARLRHAIGDHGAHPPLLLVTRESVQLNPAAGVAVDAAAFAELVAPRPGHDHRDAAACPSCVERWRQAAALYRGPLADGPLPRDAAGYEEWLFVRREWFAGRQLETLARLADACEARGAVAEALACARRALELDPWREPAHRQIMRLLAARGERSAAIAQYERCRQALAADLGVEPEEETTALVQAIRHGEPGLARGVAPAAPAPPSPEPAPAAGALSPQPLPAQPTSFVGRAGELRELQELLARPECRLITLLGPGGAGKTRLALRLAESAAGRFEDGVCWAPLAPLRTPEELPEALARAVGCAADDAGDIVARLRGALAGRRTLLVLDNVEHMVEGAGLVAELLDAAPGLSVLATSRERLQLRAEWVYELSGLAFPRDPAAADAAASDAVQLLLERARQVRREGLEDRSELAAAAAIARAVEGNALALELAAAARRSAPLAAVAAAIETDLDLLRVTLRDVPERHRSVRATLEYSWRLLSPPERRALARLAVFRGGLTPDAARAVAGADAEMLDALVDKSVLRRAGERLELHELLRRFAAEQLAALGQAQAAREDHLAWCVALAEAAEPLVSGPEQERWLARLEAEHANLRAALAWAVERGMAEPAQRIGAALMRFWWMRGHLREGRQWLERALALEGAPAGARARALHGAGGLAGQAGDLPAARRLMGASLELERAVGRKAELTRVLNNLAFVYINQAEYEEAAALVAEALALDRELGDDAGVAFDLGTLGQLAYFQGDYGRAAELFVESLAGHARADDKHSVAVTLLNLGAALRLHGRRDEARAHVERGLGLFRTIGSAYGISFSLVQLARMEAGAGRMDAARGAVRECLPLLASLGITGELAGTLGLAARLRAGPADPRGDGRLWGAAMALLDERGASLQPPEMLEFGLELAEARSRADAGPWATGWAEGRAMTTEQAVAEALRALQET